MIITVSIIIVNIKATFYLFVNELKRYTKCIPYKLKYSARSSINPDAKDTCIHSSKLSNNYSYISKESKHYYKRQYVYNIY